MRENEERMEVRGTVLNVIYTNGENGYTVIRLRDGDGDVLTAVGAMPGVTAGERLLLTGAWTAHPSFGEQFKAEQVQRLLPDDRESIYEYLAFGAVKGIGPVTAAAIVAKFGDETLSVLENEPERLAQVKGISMRKAMQIGAEFQRQAGVRRLMEFLAESGINPQLAVKLYKVYGEESMAAVRDNPYLLTDEYYGADFFQADELALRLGFDADSRERLEAALLFELRHNLGNGHTFLPAEKLIAATEQLIGVDASALQESLESLETCGNVTTEPVAGTNACYLETLYRAETYVAGRIGYMAAHPEKLTKDTRRLIAEIEKKQGITYAGLQRDAVAMAAEQSVMVLTGGPGTGKTTAVCGILALFDKMGFETVLTAPTGRAAKRLSELTGREAFTIHRLLGAGFSPESGETVFERDESDPLKADAVILDETSMVDITLMSSLLTAMRASCRLVLVGDGDQLPSVGPGNVFSDIIRSGAVPTVKLTEIFRQARESRIVRNAHLINEGTMPDLAENKSDFFFLQRPTKERAAETIVELCVSRLPKNLGIEPEQIQVLSATRKNETGTVRLNRLLQAALNPPDPEKNEKEHGEFVFREGDRVMQIRNNYDIIWKNADGSAVGAGVFNGDIGQILSIDSRLEMVTVDFDDRIANYSFDMLGELELAYAMTVHKSQGSEYRAVILSASREAPMLMSRSILYTAVTRARELLVIVGDGRALAQMVENDRRQRRYSGLRARLAGEQ